jgi:hypothetical protein
MTEPAPEAPVNPGDRFVWDHPDGLGYGQMYHANQVLTAEMTELDIKNGQEVTYMQDDDEGWRLVEWVDDQNVERITAIDRSSFQNYFNPI